jgi:uncharacterized protein (TIGR01777 family)
VIARIGLVLGLDGGALQKMLGPFKWFIGGPLGSGKQYMPWIHWKDTVRAMLFAIDQRGFEGVFNLCAPKPVTMKDFSRALGAVMGRPSVFRVPGFAVKLAVGDFARAVLTGQRAVPKKLEAAGFRFDFEDVEAALRDLVAR